MKWRIVTDSSCDALPPLEWPQDVTYGRVPFVFKVGQKEFVDDDQLNIPTLLDEMELIQLPIAPMTPILASPRIKVTDGSK